MAAAQSMDKHAEMKDTCTSHKITRKVFATGPNKYKAHKHDKGCHCINQFTETSKIKLKTQNLEHLRSGKI